MDETNRKRLITTRAVAKASLTRMVKFVNEFQESDNQAILVRLKELPVIREKFEGAQTQLELFEDFQLHAEDRDVFETMYFDLETKMTKLTVANDGSVSARSGGNNQNSTSNNSSGFKGIKLPTIQIPSFNGEVTHFRHFYDTFMSLIVNNVDLDNIQRFHYLLSSLKGEAHDLIANLPVTNSNFDVALETICNRYDNPRLIASAHLRQLLTLPSMSKASANDLRALLNQALSNLNAIKALQLDVPLEELLVSQLILEKVDISIRREYESIINSKTFPTLQELCEFLETKCKSIEIVNSNLPKPSLTNIKSPIPHRHKYGAQVQQSYVATNSQCIYCSQTHALHKCRSFAQVPVHVRREFVKSKNLCYNCLKSDHKVNDCKSGACRICNKWHHTLVHVDAPQQSGHSYNSLRNGSSEQQGQTEGRLGTISYCSFKREPTRHILLSTALVKVRDSTGKWQTCRALLDPGSQSCFITESSAQRLKLPRQHRRVPIQGIGDTTSETRHSVRLEISSCTNNFATSVDCLVLTKVTDDLPGHVIDTTEWNLPKNLPLADPSFQQPSKIDILLGAEICAYIHRSGRVTRDPNHPVLQETEFGWILSGRYETGTHPSTVPRRPVASFFVKTDVEIQNQLQRFWEIEDVGRAPLTREEQQCEAHFVQHTTRDNTGRFVVRLPFHADPDNLGDSFTMASRRFQLLERRLSRHPDLKQDYMKFMDEYEALGHMEPACPATTSRYYMPHHAILKESSSTTRTRVVFDCSASSSNGVSLNNLLMVGPTIQQDLCSIILRFRTHPIAFTADIAKMYRQVQVNTRDRTYQRILWRRDQTEPIQEYQLTTVTYGMASAPFLATRCLQQLAEEGSQVYPKAAEVIANDFYVDDCMSGCQDIEKALEMQRQLIELLEGGGFPLRKWCSNHSGLLESVPAELRETQLPLRLDNDDNVKTLGLLWHPAADIFQIVNNIQLISSTHDFTKRTVLSVISAIFDPLGFISPIVILCKIFLQQLWQQQMTWDEPLSPELSQIWQSLYRQLPLIDNIRIARRILVDNPTVNIQLHGFCDASEKAYGTCIYLRSTNKYGTTTVKLLCSKSRVAPLKKLSLPRLELCGALLLAQLLKKVTRALRLDICHRYLWTDSTIVLAWLNAPSSRWKTFVGNRVSKIQENTTSAKWRHVPSPDNPADMISRGVYPNDLIGNQLWWEGPSWLREGVTSWPTLAGAATQDIPEEKCKTSCHVATRLECDITTRFSRLTRLQRVIGYCNRFTTNCRRVREERIIGELSLQELQQALYQCIKLSQHSAYGKEIQQLEQGQPLNHRSKLLSLSPFLDDKHLLRVGGRLEHSDLTYSEKHQLILPPGHHLTRLIVEQEHRRMLHAGCQLLLASLRQQYWIGNGKSTVRNILHHCLVCHKLKAQPTHQLMGQLPPPRVEAVRPFFNCGVDFTGPFYVKTGSRRSKLKEKCYVAIFVCFATRAVHLEVVSNLSTQAFLAALKRFVSRRGRCKTIYSDNGSNFVGAQRELRDLQDLLMSEQLKTEITNFTNTEGIEWIFIPPRTPHFGGLWEAGVKSFKHHLRRTMGTMCLTFEELTTLTCQIEACLNSRPLIPLSFDPADPQVLTPGHYLIGTSITSIPQPDLGTTKLSLLSRWEVLQQRLQLFWRRWSHDYLHHLQQRTKWTSSCPNVQPGALVIVREDNLPPISWKLAVVENVHPGADGLIRVVTIRTPHGVFKRPITKLCPLPVDEDV